MEILSFNKQVVLEQLECPRKLYSDFGHWNSTLVHSSKFSTERDSSEDDLRLKLVSIPYRDPLVLPNPRSGRSRETLRHKTVVWPGPVLLNLRRHYVDP